MISMVSAGATVERLIGLDGFPSNNERRAKLVKAFRHADTEEIALRAISMWVSDSSKCPGPSEIAAIITDLNVKHREQVGVARAQCVACAGTGWVQMVGVSRFDGLAVTGAQPCLCRSLGQPVVADRDACFKCGGHGLHGGHIGTDRNGPWEACLCPAGRTDDAERRVAQGNAARARIIASESAILQRLAPLKRMTPDGRAQVETPIQRVSSVLAGWSGDEYHGEF